MPNQSEKPFRVLTTGKKMMTRITEDYENIRLKIDILAFCCADR